MRIQAAATTIAASARRGRAARRCAEVRAALLNLRTATAGELATIDFQAAAAALRAAEAAGVADWQILAGRNRLDEATRFAAARQALEAATAGEPSALDVIAVAQALSEAEEALDHLMELLPCQPIQMTQQGIQEVFNV